MAKKVYAVKKGRSTGIFNTWAECKAQIDGFSGAVYKSFTELAEAKAFIEGGQSVRETAAQAVAYVDGSYNIRDKRFSYGAVIFYNGEKYTLSKAFEDEELAQMRNVAGEIKGAEAAMQFCIDNDIKSLDIYYDYEGIAKWCLGEWKANKLGTIAYTEFYKAISKKVQVNFIKVKGHSGDKYNDEVDALAKKALGII